ncbi:hypothetical protein LZ31DRAFT_104110 [Colletotrichum somersetense]|nr:hypothetical protein LZ31DRAFT_104110 [Colletotrichum somersetense]
MRTNHPKPSHAHHVQPARVYPACLAFCVVLVAVHLCYPHGGPPSPSRLGGGDQRLISQPKTITEWELRETHQRRASGLSPSTSSACSSLLSVINIQTSLISFRPCFALTNCAAVWRCPPLGS